VFDQRTTIREEVAQRLAGIYAEAGFDYAYFDGAEDVPPPYWFNVSWAQWLTRAQKEALRNLDQEHILLINEKGEFELVPYWEIKQADK
jgi:hypothetical protein